MADEDGDTSSGGKASPSSPFSETSRDRTRHRQSAPNVLSPSSQSNSHSQTRPQTQRRGQTAQQRHQHRHSHIILTQKARADRDCNGDWADDFRSNGSISRVKDQLSGALKFKGLMNLKLKARRANRKSSFSHPGGMVDLLHNPNPNPSQLSGVGSGYGTLGLEGTSRGGMDQLRDGGKWWQHPGLELLLSRYLNVLLLLLPFALVGSYLDWSPPTVFVLNFICILPLAQLLGDLTEEVALYTNETIGGLINATLGNATELIISIFAIEKGLLRVVQVSLLGSVLSNQLLVTGCCFFFGGLFHTQQDFNARIASIDSSLLLIAVLGLTIPAGFASAERSDCHVPCRVESIVPFSHATALFLFTLYGLLLIFQLKTHKHLMDGENVGATDSLEEDDEYAEEDEEETPSMSLTAALVMLTITTLFVAVCSELLVGSLEDVSQTWGLSQVFIGLILLPIIGNAAEHSTAVTVAIKGKMDLALGVALGSSVQIALCVVPALCLVGWVMDKPLTLDFHIFETTVLIVSVLVGNSAVSNGTSTWLEGIMLIFSYCIIGLAYFFRSENEQTNEAMLTCVCGDPCCFP